MNFHLPSHSLTVLLICFIRITVFSFCLDQGLLNNSNSYPAKTVQTSPPTMAVSLLQRLGKINFLVSLSTFRSQSENWGATNYQQPQIINILYQWAESSGHPATSSLVCHLLLLVPTIAKALRAIYIFPGRSPGFIFSSSVCLLECFWTLSASESLIL